MLLKRIMPRFYRIGATEAECPEWIFGVKFAHGSIEVRFRPPISIIYWKKR
jgi:hypothetical protein